MGMEKDIDQNENQIPIAAPRENIINTAVRFLTNKNVLGSPLEQKQKFLRSKGVTEEEIRIACTRAGTYADINLPPSLPPPFLNSQLIEPRRSRLERFRDYLSSAVLFGGLLYGIYLFYKRFIRPWLFGDRKKSTEESLEDINKLLTTSVADIRDNLEQVKVEVDKIRARQPSESSTQSQFLELKNEISSVKGLLLSRKQFPSVPSSSVVPPSIPAWQLSAQQTDNDGDDKDKAEDLMELGSGSGGSSETEVVTKNSDSSLEIV